MGDAMQRRIAIPSHWMMYFARATNDEPCPRGLSPRAIWGRFEWYQRDLLYDRWVHHRNARFLRGVLVQNEKKTEKQFQRLVRRNENNRLVVVFFVLFECLWFFGAIAELINVDDWDRGKFPICLCSLPVWILCVWAYSYIRSVRFGILKWLARREEIRLVCSLFGNWSSLLKRARAWIERKA